MIDSQIIALDYVKKGNEYFLLEMCYAFVNNVMPIWSGYWDKHLKWHNEPMNPLEYLLENILIELKKTQQI